MIFPEERQPSKEVLFQRNNSKLIRNNGRLELWTDNDIVVIEGFLPIYQKFQQYIKGDVLEVGTGLGEFTQFASSLPGVTKIWTVDINGDFTDIYLDRFGTNSKVVLVKSDIFQYIAGVSKRFDCIFYDLEYTVSRADYNKLKQFCQWAGSHLRAGGNLILQTFQEFPNQELINDVVVNFSSANVIYDSSGRKMPLYILLSK